MRSFKGKIILFLVIVLSFLFNPLFVKDALALGTIEKVVCCKKSPTDCFLTDLDCSEIDAKQMDASVCLESIDQFNAIRNANSDKDTVGVTCLDEEKNYFTNNNKSSSQHKYLECKVVSGGEVIFLPGKLSGTENEYDILFDGVTCDFFYKNHDVLDSGGNFCANDDDCPFGTDCQPITWNGKMVKGCEIRKCGGSGGCKANETCSGVEINTGETVSICTRKLTEKEKDPNSNACFCPQGQNNCIPTFFCNRQKGSTLFNACYSNICLSQTEQNTLACSTSKDCWERCLMKACDKDGLCKAELTWGPSGNAHKFANDYDPKCPPYFLRQATGNGEGESFFCLEPACPNNDDFKELLPKTGNCKTDADCEEIGYGYKCQDAGVKQFNYYLEKNLGSSIYVSNICKGDDTDAMQWFYKKCVGVAASMNIKVCRPGDWVPESKYAGVSFDIPSIGGLNQLNEKDLPKIIGNLIKTALGVVGSIALAMFVYGGILWMTGSTSVSGGATKKDILKAKSILVWSTLGIIMILSSYVIVSFVMQAFGT